MVCVRLRVLHSHRRHTPVHNMTLCDYWMPSQHRCQWNFSVMEKLRCQLLLLKLFRPKYMQTSLHKFQCVFISCRFKNCLTTQWLSLICDGLVACRHSEQIMLRLAVSAEACSQTTTCCGPLGFTHTVPIKICIASLLSDGFTTRGPYAALQEGASFIVAVIGQRGERRTHR